MERKCKIHIIITVLVMVFIFIHSAMPGDVSGAESGFFVEILRSLTGADPEVLSTFVRKGAHFAEYMILGMVLFVNACDWQRSRAKARFGGSQSGRGTDKESDDVSDRESDKESDVSDGGTDKESDMSDSALAASKSSRPDSVVAAWAFAWAAGTAYAATDEIHQAFVPGRACAVTDVLIDSAGIATGAALMAVKERLV